MRPEHSKYTKPWERRLAADTTNALRTSTGAYNGAVSLQPINDNAKKPMIKTFIRIYWIKKSISSSHTVLGPRWHCHECIRPYKSIEHFKGPLHRSLWVITNQRQSIETNAQIIHLNIRNKNNITWYHTVQTLRQHCQACVRPYYCVADSGLPLHKPQWVMTAMTKSMDQ